MLEDASVEEGRRVEETNPSDDVAEVHEAREIGQTSETVARTCSSENHMESERQ